MKYVCVYGGVRSSPGLNVPVCLHNINHENLGRSDICMWGGSGGCLAPIFQVADREISY